MYLQLAENDYDDYEVMEDDYLYEDDYDEDMYLDEDNELCESNPSELYVFIPEGFKGATKDMYIREDMLDQIPGAAFDELMYELDPFQDQMLSGKAERQARRERRRIRKERKGDIKLTKRAGRGGGARRAAKQLRVSTKQTGRTSRAGSGGGFGGFMDKVGGIVGQITGGAQTAGDLIDDIGGGRGMIDDFGNAIYSPPAPRSFFEKNKTPIFIGIGVIVIGGIAYAMTRKKK